MVARVVIRDRGRGVSSADRAAIETAVDEAHRLAGLVQRDADEIWNQSGRFRRRRRRRRDAWSGNADFVTWLGTSTRIPLIRRARRRIRKLRRWLDRGRIVFVAHDSGDRGCAVASRNAFVVLPRRPLRIHLCPNWFDRAPSRQAAILVHELVHELGFPHPEGTTNQAEALDLARRNSRKARRSPENYEHLYEAYST